MLAGVLAAEARDREVPVIFSSHQLELVERLCDDVAIIRDGRLVASGEVAELRDERSGNRWEVEVEGAEDGWLEDVPGARRIDPGVVDLEAGVDSQALLERARSAGAVTRFARRRPTLAELFHEAVGESAGDEAEDGR